MCDFNDVFVVMLVDFHFQMPAGISRLASQLLRQQRPLPRVMTRRSSQNYDGPGKTTVNILNQEVGFLMVDAYSRSGFRLNNGDRIFGPAAVFPTSVFSWLIRSVDDVDAKSLSLFSLIHPKPHLVLVGLGSPGVKLEAEKIKSILSTGLNVEFMDTEKAISTYNYLCAEGRAVGAALIPPEVIRRFTVDDHINMIPPSQRFEQRGNDVKSLMY